MFGHNLPGVYIALEGIRCCGKSTQARILAEKLRNEFPGREIILTKEPGGTKKADQIREVIVSSQEGEALVPWAEVLMFAASRAQAIAVLIEPALERGAMVVSDRCLLSSLCYQGYGLELDRHNVLQKNIEVLGEISPVTPDLIVIPDISVELSAERLALREKRDNVYDKKTQDYFKRVREGYLFFAGRLPEEILTVDGALTSEEQAKIVWERVRSLIDDKEAKRELDFSVGRRR